MRGSLIWLILPLTFRNPKREARSPNPEQGGYHVCEETIGFTDRPGKSKDAQISPHFPNNQIEYYTLNRASVRTPVI